MLKELRINNQIRAKEVNVIDEAGAQLGTMPIFDALRLAKEHELDLVEVGPNVMPPITKIMDYGKYKYQKERQEKKSAKPKTKDQDIKTVRIGFKTGDHDLQFKSEQISGFLKEGHIVKLELTLRGREKSLAEMGRTKLQNFLQKISEPFVVQDAIKRSPFGWLTILKKETKK